LKLKKKKLLGQKKVVQVGIWTCFLGLMSRSTEFESVSLPIAVIFALQAKENFLLALQCLCSLALLAKWRRPQALVGPKNTSAENLNIVRRSTDH